MIRLALALEYPLMQQGGTEVLVREFIRAFGPHSDLTLVSGDPDRSALPEEFSRLIAAHLPWSVQAKHPAQAARHLADRLQQRNPALIHWHLGFTYAWRGNRFWQSPIYHAAKRGTPSLCTTHSATEFLDSNCDLSRPAWQKSFILLRAWPSRILAMRRVRREVCVSRHDQARLRAHFPPLRGKVLKVYHSLLRAEDAEPWLESREKSVLCVGTVGGRKSQHVLAEAFSRIASKHADWHLDIVGRPLGEGEVQRIRDLAALHHAQSQVRLHGSMSHEDVCARMRRAAIFALPSLHEGLGLSLQEALFHGCVAVGSRVGGIPELIDHEQNGLLVPPGNVGELAVALERLMSDDALRARLATRTRGSIVEKGMTAPAMIENYRRIYEELLSSGGHPGVFLSELPR